MNPIEFALEKIQFQIPQQILNVGYRADDSRLNPNLLSLSTRIREKVIDGRVMADIGIIGSTEAYIDLDTATMERYDPFTVIYHIPNSATQNRPLVQVYSVHFGVLGYQQLNMARHWGQSSLAQGQQAVLDSAIQAPPASTSFINLVAPNAVMIGYMNAPHPRAYLRCRLGIEDSMSHLNTQFIPDFADLCILATKADLYNRLPIQFDQGYLSGGQQLGMMRDTLMEYSDAMTQYQEALTRWKKLMVYNDDYARRRLLKQQINVL